MNFSSTNILIEFGLNMSMLFITGEFIQSVVDTPPKILGLMKCTIVFQELNYLTAFFQLPAPCARIA